MRASELIEKTISEQAFPSDVESNMTAAKQAIVSTVIPWLVSRGLVSSSSEVNIVESAGALKAEQLIDSLIGVPVTGAQVSAPYDDGVGSTHPLEQRRKRRKENFGMAGLPGGVRNDPEDPNTYEDLINAPVWSENK